MICVLTSYSYPKRGEDIVYYVHYDSDLQWITCVSSVYMAFSMHAQFCSRPRVV